VLDVADRACLEPDVDSKREVVVVPLSDVDRARDFQERLGEINERLPGRV